MWLTFCYELSVRNHCKLSSCKTSNAHWITFSPLTASLNSNAKSTRPIWPSNCSFAPHGSSRTKNSCVYMTVFCPSIGQRSVTIDLSRLMFVSTLKTVCSVLVDICLRNRTKIFRTLGEIMRVFGIWTWWRELWCTGFCCTMRYGLWASYRCCGSKKKTAAIII